MENEENFVLVLLNYYIVYLKENLLYIFMVNCSGIKLIEILFFFFLNLKKIIKTI